MRPCRQAVEHVRTEGGRSSWSSRPTGSGRLDVRSRVVPGKAEVEKWREHDPIQNFTDRCLAEGLLTAEDIAAIEQAVATEVADAVAYAEAGTLESVDDLTRDIMTPS